MKQKFSSLKTTEQKRVFISNEEIEFRGRKRNVPRTDKFVNKIKSKEFNIRRSNAREDRYNRNSLFADDR